MHVWYAYLCRTATFTMILWVVFLNNIVVPVLLFVFVKYQSTLISAYHWARLRLPPKKKYVKFKCGKPEIKIYYVVIKLHFVKKKNENIKYI